MKIKCFFLFFFIGSVELLAQEDSAERYLILTMAPLALVDIYDGASVRLGSELRLSRRISIAVEGGPYMKYLDATKINPEGYVIKPKIKYYLNTAKGRKYVAVEFMHKEQSYEFIDKIIVDHVGQEMKYGMKRKVNTVNVKYGKIKDLGRYFLLDWYIGLGLRKIDSENDLSEADQQFVNTAENDCTFQENLIRQTGRLFYPDVQFGIKLGFKLL